MTSKKKSLAGSRLYLILDKGVCGTRPLSEVLKKALAGGVDIVQWRDKISNAARAVKEARALLAICRRRNIPFIINDRLDVALAIMPDGIHLGQGDLKVSTARMIFGNDILIGLSCQKRKHITSTLREKIDYYGFGPVFPTKTKKAGSPLGANAYKQAANATSRPVFAIGGINTENLEKFAGKKTRIAVSREICRAKNIPESTRLLKQNLMRNQYV